MINSFASFRVRSRTGSRCSPEKRRCRFRLRRSPRKKSISNAVYALPNKDSCTFARRRSLSMCRQDWQKPSSRHCRQDMCRSFSGIVQFHSDLSFLLRVKINDRLRVVLLSIGVLGSFHGGQHPDRITPPINFRRGYFISAPISKQIAAPSLFDKFHPCFFLIIKAAPGIRHAWRYRCPLLHPPPHRGSFQKSGQPL